MEKRRSQMAHVTSIEEPMPRNNSMQQQHLLQQQLDPNLHHYRQGSIASRQSNAHNGNQNGEMRR